MAADRKYWSMKAKGDKAAEILIYEQIGSGFWSEGIGAKQSAKDLKELGDIDALTVRINSEGGSVFEGQAIYSQLKAILLTPLRGYSDARGQISDSRCQKEVSY